MRTLFLPEVATAAIMTGFAATGGDVDTLKSGNKMTIG